MEKYKFNFDGKALTIYNEETMFQDIFVKITHASFKLMFYYIGTTQETGSINITDVATFYNQLGTFYE